MTVVSHEREPGELGFVARYRKLVKELTGRVRSEPSQFGSEQVRDLGWAIVEAEMLRLHVSRRLSDRLDGIEHGPEGSVDKLLMTQVEQSVGHAALSVGGTGHGGGDDTWLKVYLYSRAQSVMGGTSQIQRNLVARRILGLPGMTHLRPASGDRGRDRRADPRRPPQPTRAAERHEPRAAPGPRRAVPADRCRPGRPGRRPDRQRAGLLGGRRLHLPRRARPRRGPPSRDARRTADRS